MKKFLSILMVLAMILSLSITAFAAENKGSITITNATKDETYAIYKIFDASISRNAKGETIVSYSIKKDDQFFEALFGADGTAANTFFAYQSNGSVRKNKDANDSELTKYLTELVENGNYQEVDSVVATDKIVKFDGIDYGYYLITSSLGTTVTINSNTPDIEVIDKNQEPGVGFDKQVQGGVDENGDPIWEDANSANIGDKITYKISFTATNYDGDKKIKHYQIHDEKGDAIWAEFNSIQVFVGGTELPRGYYLSQGGDPDSGTWLWLGDHDNTCTDGWDDVTAAEKTRDNAQWYLVHLGYDQFRITIPWLKNHQLKDIVDASNNVTSHALSYPDEAASKFDSPVDVVVTYDAVVEPGASIGDTTHGNRFNKASASWTSEHETGSTPPDEVVTHVYGIGLLKDDSANGQNLAGAIFRIYRKYDKNTKIYDDPVYVIPTKTEGVYIVDSKGTPSETVTGSAMLDSRELYGANLDDYLKDLEGNPVEQNNIVVSQVNGKLVIIGLEAGTYYLEEAKAPDGYNGLSVPVEIKAGEAIRPFYIYADEEGHVADIQEEDATHKEKKYDLTHTVVHNSQGQVLPSTGGEGTFWLITIGTLLAIGFAVFLITHKKMSVYTD